ncbi:hypothetical protein [Bradyrhizobium iriomotense]|uniref:hypothetical protein n=1 Tax=Bradyrhizobium iriomotense TaxID=441950 RepID=UPI001B8A17EC|nr:hypothetical protein [Bradyrhizobium iriomotense]MBR0786929.1 hypothetical protein [Bradyrhizobium iriomotense]
MARDINEAAEILKEHGLDLAQVLRDTHAETMLRIGTQLDDILQTALRTHALHTVGKDLDDRLFQPPKGKLQTLGSKIKKAQTVGLLDAATFADADLLREIRNEFGHLKTKLHFDHPKIVALAGRLSTYEAAETNQAAIFAATDKVVDHVRAALKNLKPVAQA